MRKEKISAPLRSIHELEKPSGSLRLFRTSTAHVTIRYTTTSITFKHVVEKLDRAERQLTQYTVRTEARKNSDREKNNLAGHLGRIHGS